MLNRIFQDENGKIYKDGYEGLSAELMKLFPNQYELYDAYGKRVNKITEDTMDWCHILVLNKQVKDFVIDNLDFINDSYGYVDEWQPSLPSDISYPAVVSTNSEGSIFLEDLNDIFFEQELDDPIYKSDYAKRMTDLGVNIFEYWEDED